MKPTVGVIGLGIMGSAMAANLMRAGYAVVGYDVLASRRRAHGRAGGRIASSAAMVGEQADVVICSLPSPDALRQTASVFAGSGSRPTIVVETSTLPIRVKEEARHTLAKAGTILLDCPLSGTGPQARAKDLVVCASGDRRAYRRVTPILRAFTRAQYYVGPFGAGMTVKVVANLLVAIHNVAAAEALLLAVKAGLDPKMVVKVIGDSAGTSRMFQVRAPMMVKGDYSNAMMKLDVWRKDMAIIADFARQTESPTPLFSATRPIYTSATRLGGHQDTAAVYAVLEKMAMRRAQAKSKVQSAI